MQEREIDYKLKIVDKYGLTVEFNRAEPEKCIQDRSLFGLTDSQLIEDIKAKPFIVVRDLYVRVTYKDEVYTFVIPKGFTYDGATVPAIAWVIIGHKTEPRFKIASCVHDWLCEHHADIDTQRKLSTHIFITLCDKFGKFNKVKRILMGFFIDLFQMLFCGWRKV